MRPGTRILPIWTANVLLLLATVQGCSLIAGKSVKSLKSTGRGRDAQGRWRNWRNNAQIRGELWRVLRYKCYLAGIRLEWQQPRKTSRTCPHCGEPADTYRSPTEREQKQDWGAWLWCDHCGWNGARDYAAALNIARLGAHFITHYLQTDWFSHASIADTAVKPLSYMGSGGCNGRNCSCAGYGLAETFQSPPSPVRCPSWATAAKLPAISPPILMLPSKTRVASPA